MREKSKEKFYAKAVMKIPVWAKRPEQYCHKIIRGFFGCQEIYGKMSLRDLEELCTREDDGNEIKIWSEIEAVLMEYKSDFCE